MFQLKMYYRCQIVDFPTHGKATLDRMLITGSLREYLWPLVTIGILFESRPNYHIVAKYIQHKSQITHTFLESGMQTIVS